MGMTPGSDYLIGSRAATVVAAMVGLGYNLPGFVCPKEKSIFVGEQHGVERWRRRCTTALHDHSADLYQGSEEARWPCWQVMVGLGYNLPGGLSPFAVAVLWSGSQDVDLVV
ncbi:uncharacterized protein LOC124686467 [Lolium rigidum]|uniref:uncharacterized protein LOC124686467 n=1 Tax=Lolium rigidum TaxID=89674 RepID=UPI001F5D27FF|nr:uncharacterized protein LOC124686467 [Lolium rigidum]